MVDRSLIGRRSEVEVHEVERGAIRRFAAAIGDEAPLHRQGEIAPPTFPTTMRGEIPGLELDKKRILHAGEEYRYRRPLRAGDVLRVVRRVEDVYEKRGSLGPMTFIVLAAEGRDPSGEIVYESRTTIIYRQEAEV